MAETGTCPSRWSAWAGALPTLVAVAAIACFVRDALELASYPFDWDPGEGLVVDMAIRLRQHGLRALYPAHDVVPVPFTYGPLLPALLAAVPTERGLLAAGRWLGTGVALTAAAAVYALVRARGTRTVALAFAALALAPASHSFWLVLVRTDAAMIAAWLWAAVFLVPPRLARGSARLSWRRAAVGALLLVLAVLAKPMAMIIGAPLVLAWWLVDRRSAARLTCVVMLLGGVAFVGLELATAGGFWRTLMLQTLPANNARQIAVLLLGSLQIWAGPLALAVVAVALAAWRRDGSLRDGAWLLWLAGPVVVPTLAKAGATYNYMLPWAMAQAALTGRLFAGDGPTQVASPRRPPVRWLGATAASILALALILGHFRLPTGEDAATADSFYRFIRERGGPILAVHPDLAYVEARQPVLLEMAIFPDLYRHDLPGARALFERLDRQGFKTVVENLDRWSLKAQGYAPVGACSLAFHFGRNRMLLLVPGTEAKRTRFVPLPGSRCLAVGPRP